MRSARLTAAATAGALMVFGLAVHRLTPAGAARDIAGDAIWAAMMFWWVTLLAPARPPGWRAVLALALCWVVEVSQLSRAPWLERARATRLGPLVLGSGFDPRDLVSYTVGVLLAWAVVRWRTQRRAGPPRD